MKVIILILSLIFGLNQFVFAQDTLKGTIFFEVSSFNPSDSEILKLKSILNEQNLDFLIHVDIIGYCDDTGEKKYNESLSFKRAQSIGKIIEQELSIKDLTSYKVDGNGQIQLDNNSNLTVIEERAQNRRVDFRVIYVQHDKPSIADIKYPEADQQKQIDIENFDVGDTLRIYNILFYGGISKFR